MMMMMMMMRIMMLMTKTFVTMLIPACGIDKEVGEFPNNIGESH